MYMYIHMRTHTRTSPHLYIPVCTCTFHCAFKEACLYTSTCTSLYVHLHMYVSACTSLHVRFCMYISTRASLCDTELSETVPVFHTGTMKARCTLKFGTIQPNQARSDCRLWLVLVTFCQNVMVFSESRVLIVMNDYSSCLGGQFLVSHAFVSVSPHGKQNKKQTWIQTVFPCKVRLCSRYLRQRFGRWS